MLSRRLVGHGREVTLEIVEVLRPVAAIRRDPFVELAKRLRVQTIEPPLTVDVGGDETSVAEHA